ncbi:MAG: SpvB/TcaC N-terminal domain-containing protein [Myxococcales bacterium]|nr:SpvB/TcaC N-terminal domain-containing protein [Myxococcales bacterium]
MRKSQVAIRRSGVVFRAGLGSLLGLSLLSVTAHAQGAAGVSDERVTLPGAPGSIDGVGENAAVEGNQGSMRYRVAIDVPQGFAGVTPQVALSYSSASGAGPLGIGWSMPAFSIERMTSKGLQKYDVNDRFVADGSDELVRVAQAGDEATYRARTEGGFVRWTWKQRGSGEAGFWTAEYPDGRVATFGADSSGTAVLTSQVRVPTTNRVWRWHMTQLVDPFGHAMRLAWTKDSSGHPLLERMDYLYDGASPRHSVRFTYEGRNDIISNGTPGFELKLLQRLKDIRIFSGTTNPELVRTYVVAYESEATSGGASRITAVSRTGRGMAAYPVVFRFAYSKTLGGACDATCEKPFIRDMGTLGNVDFSTGRATLIDMNGDALPDVVFSDTQGRHNIYTARLDGEGRSSFNMTARPSAMTMGSSPFLIGDARVQVIDVNGDGFVDITQAKVPAVLCNNGSGDWVDAAFCVGSATPGLPSSFAPEEDTDVGQADPKYVRFFDYDNDRRIDWLRTFPGGSGTEVLANTADAGFVPVSVQNIGAVFDESPLQLADMNGDGLQDPVQLIASGAIVQVQYKLNFGFGTWSPNFATITLSGLDASQAALAEVQDINGDGLADVVVASGNEVRIALNRNGDRFDPVQTLTSTTVVGGSIPTRTPTTTVAYADMNGNGSDDVVWIQQNGQVQYLELFPVRPNLISRIDNGIGAVQLISYGTSVVEQVRDAAMMSTTWVNRVPNAYSVVTRTESFVTLTGSDTGGLKEITTYRYHSGFYDGVEKQFRGYEGVEREVLSDMSRDAQEPGLFVEDYDVGKTVPQLAGTKSRSRAYAGMGASLVLLTDSTSLWEGCPVADIPMTTPAIVFVCQRATNTTLVERDVANSVTTRSEYEYDGYGNTTATRELGVIHYGTSAAPRPCDACVASGTFGRPCGMTCSGDERFSTAEFITPGTNTSGAWFVNKPRRTTQGAVLDTPTAEMTFFFDGPEFEGLAAGQLTRGFLSRSVERTGPGANDVVTERFKSDSHGNIVERIEPAGSTQMTMTQRTLATFEMAGLNQLSTEVRVGGAVQSLKRDYVWDPGYENVVQASAWYPVVNGQPASPPLQTRYRFDEHDRTVRVLESGDTDANPSQEFVYELGDPSTRFLIQTRSSATSGLDVIEARCLDGRGRIYQTRAKLDATRWQVSGFTEFDKNGVPVRRFQPFVSMTGACDPMPPANVPFTRFTFDTLGRQLTEVGPDGSVRRTEYGPLLIKRFDENDTDSASPFANTPTIEEFDGLNRLVSFQRSLTVSGPQPTTRMTYDALGRIASVRDPAGTLKTQTYDALNRLLTVTDPNGGLTRYEYDANGNQVRSLDARNKAVRRQYDGANRLIAEWDEADEAGTKVTWRYDVLPGCTDCTNGGAQLLETKYPAGAERRGYDPRGNLLYLERSVDGVAFVTRRRFDGADREISTTYPSGLEVRRTYDGLSRLTGIPGYVDALEYDERGNLKRLAFANGVATDYAYDERRRLTSLKTSLKDGSALVDLGYTRDRVGNLLTVAEASMRPNAARHSATTTYDAWDRPRSMSLGRQTGDPEVLTFAFDDVDNITSVTSSLGATSKANVGGFAYSALKPNAVAKAGSLELSYDERGNVSLRGGLAHTRDAFNRLTRVTRDDQPQAEFTWGGGVERVKRVERGLSTLYAESDFEVRDGIGNLYVRLGDLRVARVQTPATAPLVLSDLAPATGTGSQKTVMGDRVIDVADAWLAQAASLNTVQLTGGPTPSAVPALLASAARRLLIDDVIWLHADQLRSTIAATDLTGAARAEQSFYPFGELRGSTGSVDAYGFAGGEHVRSTGLVHYDFRDLDPTTGRWTSVDPRFLESTGENIDSYGESLGGYIYVSNNFSNYTDPAGLGDKAPKPPKTQEQLKAAKASRSTSKGRYKALGIALTVFSAFVSLGGAAASVAAGATDSDDAPKEGTAEAATANAQEAKNIAMGSAITGAIGQTLALGGNAATTKVESLRHKQKKEDKKAAKDAAAKVTISAPTLVSSSNPRFQPQSPNSTQPVTTTVTPPPQADPQSSNGTRPREVPNRPLPLAPTK